MLKPFSFIHCADIHLGHMQHNEPRRMQDFAAAFSRVIEYALASEVDFLLISGDFFHKRAINAETLEQAVSLLSPLKQKGIPVVAIEGNHDKAFYQDKNSWLGFLNRQGYIHLLGPRFAEGRLLLSPWEKETKTGSWLELGSARIYGLGYLGVTTTARLKEAYACLEEISGANGNGKSHYTILMLHAAIDKLLGTDLGGIKKETLGPFYSRVDYLALGHIHSRYEADNRLYNPGALECVHLDECEPGQEKGFYHVTVDGEGTHVAYIKSEYRPVYRCRVEAQAGESPETVGRKVREKLGADKPPCGAQVQVRLVGTLSYNPLELDLDSLVQELKERYGLLFLEVINHTNLPEGVSFKQGEAVDRREIERHVFSQLLEEEYYWEPGDLEEAVQLVRAVKDLAASGETEQEQEIVRLLLQHASLLPEKAAGRKEGRTEGYSEEGRTKRHGAEGKLAGYGEENRIEGYIEEGNSAVFGKENKAGKEGASA